MISFWKLDDLFTSHTQPWVVKSGRCRHRISYSSALCFHHPSSEIRFASVPYTIDKPEEHWRAGWASLWKAVLLVDFVGCGGCACRRD